MDDSAPTAGHGPHTRSRMRRLGLGRFGRWALLIYATVVLALGWGYGVWRIHEDRLLTLEASHQQLATLSKSLASQIAAMVADGVGAARAGANVLQTLPPGADGQHALSLMMTGGQYVRTLFVARGGQVAIANAPGESLTSEGMPWLQQMRLSREPVWVGEVNRTSGGRELVVPIARRMPGADDAQEWAGAVLRLSDLAPVYADLLSSQASVSILSEPGRMLMQIPPVYLTDTVNLDVSGSLAVRQFQSMRKDALTLFEGPHPVTGLPRQFAVSRIEGLPLLATAGRDVADALVDWRDRKETSIQFFLLTTLAVYALAFTLQYVLNRRFFALERSEERYELAAAATNDGLFEREFSGSDVYLTPRALEMLELPLENSLLPMERLRALVHADDLPAVLAAFRWHEVEHSRIDVEARLRVGAAYRWFRIRGQATWNEAGVPERLAGAIADIHDTVTAQAAVTEARQAELLAKESLARELLAGQEQERKRLAGELHDGIGQNLSLMRNRAVLLQRCDISTQAHADVQMLIDLAGESIEDLRRVAHNLRPMHLEELGIVAALRSLVEKLKQGSDLLVHHRLEDIDDVIRGSAATHVYRIVQEATNNVLRHSGARNLWLDAIRDIDCVIIRVQDDGGGIVVGLESVGLGMFSMRERAKILLAHLEVLSEPGFGTELTLRIPISQVREDQDPGEAAIE